VIVFMAITVLLWFTIGIAEVPVVVFNSSLMTVYPPHLRPEYDVTTNYLNSTFNSTVAEEGASCVNASIPWCIINATYPNATYTTEEVNVTDPVTNETVTTFVNVTVLPNVTTCNNGTGILYLNWTLLCNYTYFPDLLNSSTRTNGQHLKYRVTFLLYIISMVVFLGWVLFIIFGGIGLVAFPFDAITDFQKRPIRISLDQFAKGKHAIGERATKLIEIGDALRLKQRNGGGRSRWARRRARSNYNKFRQAVYFLEEDYARLQTCFKLQGGKVLFYYAQLLFGLIGVVLTICWILQILLYMFTQPYPFSPFLNTFLVLCDNAWGLLGTIFYGLFAFYLLLCCIKGNFKFGLRIFILFPIHPMRVGGTLMNAFLFNTLLVLVCAVSITEFTTTAFAEYTSFTSINTLFSVSVRNLMGIKYIFLGYIYALFIMIFLTAIYLAVKPKEKPATDQIVI